MDAGGLALEVAIHVFQPVLPVFDVVLALPPFEFLVAPRLFLQRQWQLEPVVLGGLLQFSHDTFALVFENADQLAGLDLAALLEFHLRIT